MKLHSYIAQTLANARTRDSEGVVAHPIVKVLKQWEQRNHCPAWVISVLDKYYDC